MTETAQAESLINAPHPYYATEGNWFDNDCHTVSGAWADFFSEMGQSDPDLNLLYRWDWKVIDPSDYDTDDPDRPEDMAAQTLYLYFIQQRKAKAVSFEVSVTPGDEPYVRAWLTERAKTMAAVWAPIAVTA